MRRTVAISIVAALLAIVLGFIVYASTPFTAEADALESVTADPAITLTESDLAVVLAPETPTGDGLVVMAGARVEPAAYAAKLSGLVDAGVTVVIARPVLNFAILEFRPLSTFTDLAPSVNRWAVGGHSLGGVRACQYVADDAAVSDDAAVAPADDPSLVGLVLLGSYCSADLASSDIPVLSLSGENDGLSTPEKIEANAHLLPSDATFVEIPGANHAQFGDYGVQPGDGESSATDAAVTTAITIAVLELLGR